MIRLPFLTPARYTFVLTPEGLELACGDESVPPVHVPLPPGVMAPETESDPASCRLQDPEALRQAVRAAVALLGRRVRRAHLALDGHLVRTVTLPIPFVPSQAELDLAVRSEAERYRVFAGAEVATDFSLLDSDEGGVTVLLAAARRDHLARVAEAFAAERIAITSIEPASLAMLRGLAELKTAPAPEAVGLVQVFPRQLHVSTWKGDALQTWRTLYVDGAALRAGDPVAIAEASLDLQRSLVSLGAAPWVLVGVPEALAEALPLPPGVSPHPLAVRDERGLSLTMRGARRYPSTRPPFVFDLRRDRLKPERAPVSRAVWIAAAFAGMLLLGLGVEVALTREARLHEGEADRLQAEIAAMQARLAPRETGADREAVLREALTRSEAVVSLFGRFQDATPHDVWLSRTSLDGKSQLVIEGYSLSQEGPLQLARALGESRSLSAIAVPQLAEAEYEGEVVHRFRLEARFVPQGRFRP
jgi:hypothetical protein